MSIHQTKLLAFMTGAIAYIGVSEAFLAERQSDNFDDDTIKKLIKDIGPISLLPDKIEVLLMLREYKKDKKLNSDLVAWTIENRKLINRRNLQPDVVGGRMTGIIQP